MSEAQMFFFCTVTAFGFGVLPQTVYYFCIKNCYEFAKLFTV